MIKIGLVGEDPNDTSSIKNLLSQKFGKKVKFLTLAKRVKGHHLDTPKIQKVIQLEYAGQKCNFIIFIRDLDGYSTDIEKVAHKTNWFKKLNLAFGGNNLFLLNIWELESLILSDIDTFNKIYSIKYKFNGDATKIKDPKEKLASLTSNGSKRFNESHCPDIFKKLNINIIENNCSYFRSLLNEINEKIDN